MGWSKEEANEYAKKYYQEHKEEIALKAREYREKNRDEVKEYAKICSKKNKDKRCLTSKEWYYNNKDEALLKNKEWRDNNKDHRALYSKNYREDNRERLSEYFKDWRSQPYTAYRIRIGILRNKYGVTEELLSNMLNDQRGCCKTCGDSLIYSDSKTNYHIDHCHTTGTVRGLLCHSCNVSLGHLKENIDTLRNMIAYLES